LTLVTLSGASSGIGAATASLLALQGAHLVITGRNEANLNQVAEKCYEETWNRPKTVLGTCKTSAQSSQCGSHFIICFSHFLKNDTGDLTDEEDVRRIFHSTLTFYGRIDVLINNAGILEQGSIENTSLDQLDRMMKTNVRYTIF
jgi:NADP-dependent 3-hydroxy acid dehydrogenase YdfG